MAIQHGNGGQELEHLHGLMRPESTQYLIKITEELAEILGIDLAEVKGEKSHQG